MRRRPDLLPEEVRGLQGTVHTLAEQTRRLGASLSQARIDDLYLIHVRINESARDLHLDLNPIRVRIKNLVRDLDLGLVHARSLVGDLDDALSRAQALDEALARALTLVRSLAENDLAQLGDAVLSHVFPAGFTDIQALTKDLDIALRSVERKLAVGWRESEAPRVNECPRPLASPAVRPAKAAVRVNGWAVRLLPTSARARFSDELLDELYALSDDGAGRWAEIACAVRQVLPGTWQIRAALREERRATGQGS